MTEKDKLKKVQLVGLILGQVATFVSLGVGQIIASDGFQSSLRTIAHEYFNRGK
jgi:hypothetical protein